LIDIANALEDILKHKPEQAWKKLAGTWPSLPGQHEQRRVSTQQLRSIYNQRLKLHAYVSN
jgi:muramidase (phage lysozyme)